MGCQVHTDVPQTKQHFIPKWPHLKGFRDADAHCKDRQKRDYERRHRTRSLPAIPDETPVWVDIPGGQVPGQVVGRAGTPRSYRIEVRSGTIRRNRVNLRPHLQPQLNLQGLELPVPMMAPPLDRQTTSDTEGGRCSIMLLITLYCVLCHIDYPPFTRSYILPCAHVLLSMITIGLNPTEPTSS